MCICVCETYIRGVYVYCWLNVCVLGVEMCEIWLKWFQKKVDKQKKGKTYFQYEYLVGVKSQLTGVLSW